MNDCDQIHLRDHVLATDIGAFQSERGAPQRLRFDIVVDLAAPVSCANDDVDRILSYDVLTEAITTALGDARFNLLETLAEKIAAEVLAHPRAGRVRVRVEKLDRVPGALGVSITRQRARLPADGAWTAPVVRLCAAPVSRPEGAVILCPDAPGLPLPRGGNARRIALLALDQQAWTLGGELGLDVADSRTELDWAAKEGHPIVWAPARMTADIADLPAEPLAVAHWLANRLGAQRLELALPEGAPTPTMPGPVPVIRLNP